MSRRRRPQRVVRRPVHVASARRPVPTFVLAAALLFAGGWAYTPSLRGVFLLDDIRAIVRNPTIRTLWPITTPLSPPTATTVAGRPVANLTFAVSYALAPGDAREVFLPHAPGNAAARDDRFLRNARVYHVTNLLIHLAAGVVLFGVVKRTLTLPRLL